ncbi:MAG TPA: site-2 protease family protein, partial [Pirellulaceae bacterium]|nr:site-2 protease family protein [Pirellulaceae bacterium]
AVDGEPVASYYELQQALWKRADQAVKFTVRRTEGESLTTVEVEVQPNRRRTLGLVMKHGAISGVRPGSPAEKAGLRPGDQLDAIAGQPIGNPVTLPHRLREWFGKEVEVTVKRPQGKDEFETVTVKLTVDVPASTASTEEPADLNIVGVESLGIAYPVFDTVAAVEPDSPAAAAGMQPGDKLQTVQFVVDDSAVAKAKELFGEDLNTPMVLDPSRDHWLEVEASLQRIVRESKVRVTFQRGDKTEKADITPVDDAQVCIPQRGLLFTAKTELLVVDSWGEAISLGFRQTREDARRIGGLVYRLITGKVSYKNLGGPLSIGVMAASEASKGLPSLLLFLTFLSANLAVLNFLPIPALDGGHMVFLLWEGIFRKPVNERVQMALTMAGVLCLLGLMVVVFGLDFWRFTR